MVVATLYPPSPQKQSVKENKQKVIAALSGLPFRYTKKPIITHEIKISREDSANAFINLVAVLGDYYW
jgi:hypothetical protein